ncbi:flagellar assembly protein FliW [Pontibacillus litoralis]|uniref:Flagellar assembly factor FliW n=1 Tax=Pontibacillus litoralis JSM 072002 TaxID=1385512 RepID=A0A0A5FZP9_9BACI|nr:flagellar assembly protein FliW [Pontibacillus litoralis]KGX86311.1 flagellar assembly protein FliW [Pontibacillus litoralis JSM 072002]
MQIETKLFGQVEINEDDVFHFSSGLPGFEQEQQFILLPIDEAGIYQSMQSVQNANVALIVTNPYVFFKDYEFTIDASTLNSLEIETKQQVTVFTVLTLQDPFASTTANLQAPIIVNHTNNKGKQMILTDTLYTTKHPIMPNGKDVHADAHSQS